MNDEKYELGGFYVHVPDGARVNTENKPAPEPETEYEKRRMIIDRTVTKKLCGGKYGRSDDKR